MQLTVYKMDKKSLLESNAVVNLRNADNIHKVLTKAVNSSRAEAALLYRVRIERDHTYLYVQTEKEINDKLLEKYGFYVINRINVCELCSSITEQNVIKFNVVVYPMQQTKMGEKCINDKEKRKKWLLEHLSKGGITTTEEYLIEVRQMDTEFTKSDLHGNAKRTKFSCFEFEGVGQISDANAFKSAIKDGIGRCKNYGMGLMMFQIAY